MPFCKMINFTSLDKYKQGLLYSLLFDSYKEFPDKANYVNDWKKFDKEAFTNPKIGECIIVTCIDNKPIGFVSYDSRQGPEFGIIGHNCVLPKYQGQGYGKKQIEKLLKKFKELHYKKACVKTGDHPFFINANKMYLSLGFKEIKRFTDNKQNFPVIEYEMNL